MVVVPTVTSIRCEEVPAWFARQPSPKESVNVSWYKQPLVQEKVLKEIGPTDVEIPEVPQLSRTYTWYEVPKVKPLKINGFVVAATTVPDPGVNPTEPYSICHAVAPPVVQVTCAVVDVNGVTATLVGGGHDGAEVMLKSSIAMSAICGVAFAKFRRATNRNATFWPV